VLLFQSVRELLINSAKHAGTGQAALTMEKRADHLCITVKDEGTGFDLAAAAAGVPSGGISSKFGLYSIQERMRALGGTFTINSALGHGTSATLVLPLAGSAETNVLNPASSGTADSALSTQHSILQKNATIRVLLVDDHAMVRQGLRSVLDAYADIQVMGEARDGVEAMKLVEQLRPQVVVMDINMPKMNGIEATLQIKTKWPETVIIGISVNVGDDNNDAMQRAGAATLLTKEAAVEQLHDTIVQAVGSQRGPAIP
jgi:CheY-like chemotaxis protein